jgi:Ion channel
MISNILIAGALVAITVAVHAGGLAALLAAFMGPRAPTPKRFWPIAWLLVRVTWGLIAIHLAEITVWALFYLWAGCLPDAESALYFSGVTYATIGFGDLVLQAPWRLLAPVEGLTGILMCGLSAALFFALVSRIYAPHHEPRPN